MSIISECDPITLIAIISIPILVMFAKSGHVMLFKTSGIIMFSIMLVILLNEERKMFIHKAKRK